MNVLSGLSSLLLLLVVSIPSSAYVVEQKLSFIPGEVIQQAQPGEKLLRTISLSSSVADVNYSLSSNSEVSWVSIMNPEGKTSPFTAEVSLKFDANGLKEGFYTTFITANADGGGFATLKITFKVAPPAPKVLYIYGEIDRFGNFPEDEDYEGVPFQQMRLDDDSPTGMSKFGETIEQLGFTVDQASDRSLLLTDAFLSQYKTIILASNQKRWSPGEAQAVERWVRKGGGIVAFNDANFGGDFRFVGQDNELGRDSNNLLISQFGLFFFTDQGGNSGANLVNTWTSKHFINTINTKAATLRFRGRGCSPIRVLDNWPEKQPGDLAYQLAPFQRGGQNGTVLISDPDLGENIQDYSKDCSIAAAEVGKGRIVATFDRNTFWNKGVGTNINQYNNYEFTQNIVLWASGKSSSKNDVQIDGELKIWHKISLTFEGPDTHEMDTINPFLDYRLNVTFSNGKNTYVVPGFYAADGNAAETSDSTGNKWRVHFTPDAVGEWTYEVSFRTGDNIAISLDASAGISNFFDGLQGTIQVDGTDKTGRDFRRKGFLRYVGEHHLRFQNGDWFLKAGADSPETLLAFADFDNTFYTRRRSDGGNEIKTWSAHVQDWTNEDATWQGGKGKGLIGAMNYLSSKGNNAMSFLTYNAGGDGRNVWPFVNPDDPLHYDCSKLDQWEIIFEHGDKRGIYLHFKMQEEENDNHPDWGLDGGNVGIERKLYYRELIARFGHHLALNWNIGEENTQTREQQQDMIAYIDALDPYNHPIVIHTFPLKDEIYEGLVGSQSELTGASLQLPFGRIHRQTLKWVKRSAEEGKKWVVANDEQNPFQIGAPPDTGFDGFDGNSDPSQRTIRKSVLWGNLMAGGAGVEYYFGYQLPENDLNCENWYSRDKMWDYNRYALEFFQDNFIPFWKMTNRNDLIGNTTDNNIKYCLAIPDSIYVIYLAEGGTTELYLNGDEEINYELFWYNPRTGGALQQSNPQIIASADTVTIGPAPSETNQDWVALLLNPGTTLAVGPDLEEETPFVPNEEDWFNVFPNPSSDYVQVAYNGPSVNQLHTTKVRLYDQDGKLLASNAFALEEERWVSEFTLKYYPPGTYYIVIDFGEQKVRKIVISDF